MNWFEDVKAFHEKYGLNYEGKVRMIEQDLAEFRSIFISEEGEEYGDSIVEFYEGDDKTAALAKSLDALIDCMYVVLGTAYLHGFTPQIMEEAWRRVHEANMSKVRAASAGDSKRGSHYDVVKPKGWQAPVLTDLVEDHEKTY